MEFNNLTEVKVRLNQYAPIAEFKRLVKNKSVGAGWRYTIGIIVNLFYTILPEDYLEEIIIIPTQIL